MYEILNVMDDEIFVIDATYRLSFLNRKLKQKIREEQGLCYEIIEGRERPCESPQWSCPLKRVIKENKPFVFVHPFYAEGEPIPIYLKIGLYPLENGYFMEIRRDVTAERELERQILVHHNHLDAISRISSTVSGLKNLRKILDTALDTILEIFTGAIGGILLYDEKKETLSYEVEKGFSLSLIEGVFIRKGEGISGKVAETGEPLFVSDISKSYDNFGTDVVFKEGIRSIISIPLKAKEKVVGVLNVMSTLPNQFKKEDIYFLNSIGCQLGMAIEQARLYERLTNARERYKKLLEVTFAIQEEERKRIARELHDETSQNLTALSLNLEAVKEMIEQEGLSEDVKTLIRKSHGIAVSASVELTKIIRELRPTLLDTLGLPAAINHLVETNLKSKNINTTVQFEGITERLPAETELALFRITQEAISNILRHSRARNAKIVLRYGKDEWELMIEDDGVGFDIEQIKTIEDGGRGAGLFGMKERLRLIGGYGWIESATGQGTKISAHIPRKKTKVDEEDKDINCG